MVCPLRLKKAVILAIIWMAAGILLLPFIWSRQGENKATSVSIPSANNGIEVFDYTCYDPQENYRPVFSVHFDRLTANNGKLGFFNTGLHKVVQIKNLDLAYFNYLGNQGKPAFENFLSSNGEDRGGNPLVTSLADIFRKSKEMQIRIVDVSNASRVSINGFRYSELDEKQKILSVASTLARFLHGQPELQLRGHVTITAKDGSKLESNTVRWDLKRQVFVVEGSYLLNRGESKRAGRDACFDRELNFYNSKQASRNSEEDTKWLAGKV